MARNLLDLANSLDKLAEKIPQAASKIAIKVADAIIVDLAQKTPVDTSAAISNWIVSLGGPTASKISPHYSGIFGSTYTQSSAQTIERARYAFKNKKPGQSIFITNNQDYIRDLNAGTSKQEPAGFVERAVLIGRKTAKQSKLKG